MSLFSRANFQAYAKEYLVSKLESSLFERNVILSVLAGQAEDTSAIGRPGAYTVLGGRKLSKAQRRKMNGSERAHAFFQVSKVGGGKWMGERDSTPTTGNTSQDQQRRSASFAWSYRRDPIKVWNTTLGQAKDQWQIAAPIDEATDMAMEEHFEAIGTALYEGNPPNQEDPMWKEPLGLKQICHTTNTYGTVNRSTYTAWAGRRVTDATAASIEMVDDMNIEHGGNEGITAKGKGVDLVLAPSSIYKKLKRQAVAQGVSIVRPNIADHGMLGYLNEYIEYGKTKITFDPYCPASHVFGLTTESLNFEIHPDYNFDVTEFKDQGAVQGGDDATTANVCTWFRFWTGRPWDHIVFTNVS